MTKFLRALTLGVICLGGAALFISSMSLDLVGFGQQPVARVQVGVNPPPADHVDPLDAATKSLKELLSPEKDDQLRRLLEDSSEIDLKMPTFLQSEYRVEVEEEAEPLDLPRVVARVGALSTGLNFGALVFSLNKECCFSIDAASGAVSLVTPLDRDGKSGAPLHRLTVTVREGGLEAQAKLYVVVKDVNDNEPTFEVEEYTVNRGEVDMVSEGEELIKVLATDLDDPDTDENGLVTYSLASGQEFFKIDPHTGLISARVALERGIWKADVVAADGGGLTGSTRLVVNVGEVEERVVVRDVNNFEEVEEERSKRRKRFLTEQQIRLDTLDSYCSSRKQWPGINSNVIYVLQERQLVWCPVYKAASTNWMYNLLFLAGRSEEEVEATKARHPNQPNDAGREVAPRLSYSGVLQAAGEEGATNLLVVRHPFERIISAFRDKLEQCHGPKNCTLDNNWYYKTYSKRIVSQHRSEALKVLGREFFSPKNNFGAPYPVTRTWRSDKMPSWWEFVQYLLSTPPSSYDEHWIPVSKYCSPCSLHYTRILHSETIQEEEQELAIELGASGLIKPRRENDNSGGRHHMTDAYFSLLSDNDIEALFNIYRDDFLMFGYHFTFRGRTYPPNI